MRSSAVTTAGTAFKLARPMGTGVFMILGVAMRSHYQPNKYVIAGVIEKQ